MVAAVATEFAIGDRVTVVGPFGAADYCREFLGSWAKVMAVYRDDAGKIDFVTLDATTWDVWSFGVEHIRPGHLFPEEYS